MCGTITSVSLCIQLFDAVNGVLGGPASCLGGGSGLCDWCGRGRGLQSMNCVCGAPL